MSERIREKLQILSAAAKYDVSCSSSGGSRTNYSKGIGNSSPSGICHSFTEDGRCISLLKILLTNYCIFDCAFCASRRSNDTKRVAFIVNEVVSLTMNFYRRNYIEGLFLSSGIFKNPDYTMERLLRIVKRLRLEERFNGYIHLKTIPGASQELVTEAGLYADRMSINLEMPTEAGLKLLAPEKTHAEVRNELALIQHKMIAYNDEKKVIKRVPRFVPAGQSTQMVIGATQETDKDIMHTANEFYKTYGLKRVYYSGYLPINNDARLPMIGSQPPLLRENRLYQTDWLLRFYKFDVSELLNDEHPNLDTDVDPKLGWALRNLHLFPVDVNTADYQTLLRVPGIGLRSAKRIVQARKYGRLRVEQLKKIGISYNRAQHFINCADAIYSITSPNPQSIKNMILKLGNSKYNSLVSTQLSLF